MYTTMNLNSYSPFINSLTANELTDFEHYCFVIYDAFSRNDGDSFLEYYPSLLSMVQEKETYLGLELFPACEKDNFYTHAIVDLAHLVTAKMQQFTIANHTRFLLKKSRAKFLNVSSCNEWMKSHCNIYVEGFSIDKEGRLTLQYYQYPYRLNRQYQFDDAFVRRFDKLEMNKEIFEILWKMEHPELVLEATNEGHDQMIVLYHKNMKGGEKNA